MATRMASDEVTDGIAAIEMHRQGTEKESGLAVSVSEALRKLQELLAQEKEAQQANGADPVCELNVEAVANEIRRVQAMTGSKGQRPMTNNNARPRDRDRQQPRPEKAHNVPRNRGRRTMGRTGGRSGGGAGGGRGGGGVGGGGGGSSGGGASGGS